MKINIYLINIFFVYSLLDVVRDMGYIILMWKSFYVISW